MQTFDPTACVRESCQSIVHARIPHESRFFDTVWDAFWKQLDVGRVEDLLDSPHWNRGSITSPGGIAVLGQDGRAMDSFYVLGSITGAMVTLLQKGKGAFLETATIDAAIRAETTRLNVPAHVRRILESHGTALLAEHFAAIDWQSTPAKETHTSSSRLWVEWTDSPSEASGSPQFGAFDRNEMIEKFDSKRKRFELFVDESTRRIYVYPDHSSSNINLWTHLSARHLRLLYLVLHACCHSRFVPYQQIAKTALQDELASASSVRRTKSELNDKLGRVLDRMLQSRRGMERYEIELVPYCWIRYESTESALLGP